MSSRGATKFTSRGRLTGLLRDEVPAGGGPNRANRSAQRGSSQAAIDDAIYYRARLILGDSLVRPGR